MPILDITKSLTEADLRTTGFLDQIHEYTQIAAEVHNGLELDPWYREIKKVIDASPNKQELEEVLRVELAQMRFLTSVQLFEEEIPQIFTADIAEGVKIKATDFDPWIMIRKRLATYPHWLRNDFKSRWLKDLHQNGQTLTTNQIIVAGAQVSGTVMNWLKDYDLAVGTLAPADALKKTQYVFRGANIQKTPEEQREYVQRLVEIYEHLKQDSLSLGGMEQSPLLLAADGRFKRILDGVMVDIETGLPEAEYKKKFGVVAAPSVTTTAPVVAPTPRPKPTPPAPVRKPVVRSVTKPVIVPPPATQAPAPVVAPKPKRVTRKAVVPVQPTPPVETARVAQPAVMTDVDMQALPPTVIKRPSPAASSPKQTPQLTGNLPTGSATPKSGELVFSDEDEKEVANIRQVQKIFFKAPEGIDYDYVAKKVMAVHKLFFPSYDLERRFGNLVTSYMKGVRDQMEFKDLMTRPENTGGLNLSGDVTDKIILTIGEEAQNAPQAKARQFGAAIKSQLTPSMGQVKKAMAQTYATEGKVTATGDMVQAPVRAPGARVTRTTQPTPTVRAPLDTRKPLMTDIKVPPKVMGPVDELANLSVVEFRRLGGTAQAATEKIKAKIDLLEAESLLKRSEGIKAWQNSPVNQLYVQLGQEALNTGRQMEEVVQQRTWSEQPVLTTQEFDAIADLNKRLRY
ncbi:MAG: hypothetical protein AAB558_02320 [Patescibacteria group bacterium]